MELGPRSNTGSPFGRMFISIGFILGSCGLSLWNQVRLYEVDSRLVVPTDARASRFPTVDDRVKLYMGDWYWPPCDSASQSIGYTWTTRTNVTLRWQGGDDHQETVSLDGSIYPDRLFAMDRSLLRQCATNERNKSLRHYCQDVVNTIFPILARSDHNSTSPLLLQFGDAGTYGVAAHLPHLKKFRRALDVDLSEARSTDHCEDVSSAHLRNREGIIWLLDIAYHYGRLPSVNRSDVDWSLKKPAAVFRGKLTGHAGGVADVSARCEALARCRLVRRYHNSTLVDAKISDALDRVPEMMDGIRLVAPRMSMKDQLEYKAIIVLEGNDVGTSLKWALYSRSVVLMPLPTVTSYAMEELLEPWKHYVPLKSDLTDVEEQVLWVLHNDDEARAIAERGSMWIHDLLFAPESLRDNMEINKRILSRYQSHFRHLQLLD